MLIILFIYGTYFKFSETTYYRKVEIGILNTVFFEKV